MKIGRVKTEKWHNYEEGDVGRPIQRKDKNLSYFKKGFWKRHDRKKFIKEVLRPCLANYIYYEIEGEFSSGTSSYD